MRLSPEELEAAAHVLFDALTSGIPDDDAMDELGVDEATYSRIKAKMFDLKAEEVRTKPTEHVYVQYMLDQAANIRDLTGMISEFKKTKQYNAMVGAIRTRADLQDRLIKQGQDFGLIQKSPAQRQVVAGIVITEMTNVELKRAAMRELRTLSRLMESAGDVDFLDVEASEVHRGPALKAPEREPLEVGRPEPKAKKRKKTPKQRM
jgi:hypothetical protein